MHYLKSGYVIHIPVGHSLYTQFTRPFPLFQKWVWLVRLIQGNQPHPQPPSWQDKAVIIMPVQADEGCIGGFTERGCPYSRNFEDISNTAMFFVYCIVKLVCIKSQLISLLLHARRFDFSVCPYIEAIAVVKSLYTLSQFIYFILGNNTDRRITAENWWHVFFEFVEESVQNNIYCHDTLQKWAWLSMSLI